MVGFDRSQSRAADHDVEGILILKGRDTHQGIEVNAGVVDGAPAFPYLDGLPIRGDMDGRVLQEALVAYLESKPPRSLLRGIPSGKSTLGAAARKPRWPFLPPASWAASWQF